MTDMTLRPNSTAGSPGRTYIWYNEQPVYPFGWGLHYTNFTAAIQPPSSPSTYGSDSHAATYDISTLASNCTASYKDLCPFTTFPVSITNIGKTTSDYVTLGFLAGTHGPAPYPNKRLVSYQRLHNITAGTSQTAQLNLTLGSLARVDERGNKVLYPGDYALTVDTQPLAMVNFTLTGQELILDEWPQAPAARRQTNDYFMGGFGSEQVLLTEV